MVDCTDDGNNIWFGQPSETGGLGREESTWGVGAFFDVVSHASSVVGEDPDQVVRGIRNRLGSPSSSGSHSSEAAGKLGTA